MASSSSSAEEQDASLDVDLSAEGSHLVKVSALIHVTRGVYKSIESTWSSDFPTTIIYFLLHFYNITERQSSLLRVAARSQGIDISTSNTPRSETTGAVRAQHGGPSHDWRYSAYTSEASFPGPSERLGTARLVIKLLPKYFYVTRFFNLSTSTWRTDTTLSWCCAVCALFMIFPSSDGGYPKSRVDTFI